MPLHFQDKQLKITGEFVGDDDLTVNLGAAYVQYFQPKSEEHNLQRKGARTALIAVLHYFERHYPESHWMLEPLVDLCTALTDADEGRSNPMLVPAKHKHKGGAKILIEEQSRLAVAAAMVTIRKRAQPDANLMEIVSQIIAENENQYRDHGPDEILEFRKNLGKGRAPELAQQIYRFALQELRQDLKKG